MQIAFAFAGTDVFEKPASWRDLAESGLRNDIITDLEVRPIIFDEHDRERDQTWGGLIFGTALGTTDTDLQARFRPPPCSRACMPRRTLQLQAVSDSRMFQDFRSDL